MNAKTMRILPTAYILASSPLGAPILLWLLNASAPIPPRDQPRAARPRAGPGPVLPGPSSAR
jgi:hypothetical protein